MSRKNRRRKPMAEINVVPYIDVTLVLLIIFMITTPLLQTGVQVDLPQAESAVVEQKDELPLIVSIKADGQYYLMVGESAQEPIDPGDIESRVTAVIIEKPATPVLIEADKSIDYGTVVTVMANLKNAGVRNVGLMTKPVEK
jgi:biopolymer transport protein TolR